MLRQGASADSPLAGAHGDQMAHSCEPVRDAGALLGNLLEDSGPSVASDIVVALHLTPWGFAPRTRLHAHSRLRQGYVGARRSASGAEAAAGTPRSPLRSRGALAHARAL